MTFAELLALAEPLDDGLRLTVPADWHQGRTAYGGFSTALAYEAARRVGRDLPPLRSAQVSMIAPLAGTVEARARVLRRGRNATWVAVEIAGEARDGMATGLTATFVFMSPIASALSLDALSPSPADLIAPEDARDFVPERGPAFRLSHLDVRFARPKSPDKRPELCWWVRLRHRDGLDPATEALLVGDALPPGVLPLLAGSVQVSTMQWQIDMLDARPGSDGWWLLQSTGDYAQDGCSNQRMMMWNEAGTPVLTGLQSIALFG